MTRVVIEVCNCLLKMFHNDEDKSKHTFLRWFKTVREQVSETTTLNPDEIEYVLKLVGRFMVRHKVEVPIKYLPVEFKLYQSEFETPIMFSRTLFTNQQYNTYHLQ